MSTKIMRICDQCKKDLVITGPYLWLACVGKVIGKKGDDMHFCDFICLNKWLTEHMGGIR